MKFTGTNILYTSAVSQVNYLIKDIVLDSTGIYSFSSVQVSPDKNLPIGTGFLCQFSGGAILDPSGKFISTCNTGESFSLSGWIDYQSKYRYISLGNILSRTADSTPTSGLIGNLVISCPTSGTLNCDIILSSKRIVNSSSFDSFTINSVSTGYLSSDTSMYINGGEIQAYQSYEAPLTGSSLLAFIDNRYTTPVVYYDNDTSETNNSFQFDYRYNTTYGKIINTFTVGRTGLYNSGIVQIVDLAVETGFSGLFNGIWSGNQFVYQDSPNSLIFSYMFYLSDAGGNSYNKSSQFSVSIPSTGTTLPAEYITGFKLITGGEYTNPPVIQVTGYYYSTGIQQSLQSLLFNSGCTGSLDVTFSGGGGSGASGLLQLNLVNFSSVYSNGTKWFNTVYGYVTTNIGTGYTSPPKAYVNTGKYGAGCFDVPRASGYNQAWFSPFDTSGTMDVEAGWFSAVPLCVTGIISDGATGYIVTGIDVYNIGTGYSNKRPPLISFVRTGVDVQTRNASGTLYTNTGSLNAMSDWYVEAGLAGYSPLLSGAMTGIVNLYDTNLFYLKLVNSGVDITIPITGKVTVSMPEVPSASSVTTYFSYSKYFDTGVNALKKKDNSIGVFKTSSDLSFLLTQNELDILYSSAGYTNNTWPYSPGDFDF
jgi:hypothetical protein